MQEYFDEAVILKKESSGEADLEITLFTRESGKLYARAKSARKITSKLSAHLEPGTLSQVRWVEKNGLNIADALNVRKLGLTPLDLHFLDRLLVENEPDEMLWQVVTQEKFSWREALAVLGWDPSGAVCHKCGKRDPEYFYLKTQEFFCEADIRALRIPKSELLYLYTHGRE